MAWDGIMLRLPVGVPLSELPNDFQTPTIGALDDVKSLLKGAIPDGNYNPTQLVIVGSEFWCEFNFRLDAKGAMVEHVGVRSNVGAGALAAMKRVCEVLDLTLIDCQTGEIADFAERTLDSVKEFAEWRDRAISEEGEKSN